MCVSWTSEINAGWFHQFAPGALVLELVVQIRTTVGAIPGQQLRFTEQTRTRLEDQTNTVLLSCRWCCQEQVSQIIFYVLGGSSLGAEYCLLMWWQKAHNREFTEKLWWRLCLVGLSYPKDHGGMWTIFRLAEISENGDNFGSGVAFATFFATYLWTTASAWISIRHPKYGHVSMLLKMTVALKCFKNTV